MPVDHNISSVEAVQNSALCAVLLWSFGRGYQEEVIGSLPFLHLSFLVLPIVLYRPTLDVLTTTNKVSGLGKFVEKFARQREDLMAIHTRALSMRKLTLEAVSTGIASGLLSVIYEEGLLRANEVSLRRPPEKLKTYVNGADKLGRWIARVPPANVFSLLQVRP
jgi:hypothetical protein